MAKAITQLTIMQLDNDEMMYAKALDKIKGDTDSSLVQRWQAMIHVLLSVQLHNIVPFGYSPDEKGIHEFNKNYEILSKKDDAGKELQQLSLQRWHVLIERAFGVTLQPGDNITVEKARLIALKLSFQMLSDKFLKSVDALIAELGPSPSDTARQQALLGAILPLQMDVMREFGYEGEDGYIRLQVALAEHATDETVGYNTMASTLTVFRRAGIALPTS